MQQETRRSISEEDSRVTSRRIMLTYKHQDYRDTHVASVSTIPSHVHRVRCSCSCVYPTRSAIRYTTCFSLCSSIPYSSIHCSSIHSVRHMIQPMLHHTLLQDTLLQHPHCTPHDTAYAPAYLAAHLSHHCRECVACVCCCGSSWGDLELANYNI